jgi:hypothetical protein
MIIPRQANPNHALMKVGNDGNSILHVKIGLRCESGSETHAPQSWHQGWQVRIQRCRYKGCTVGLIASNRIIAPISHIVHGGLLKVSNVSKQSRLPKCSHPDLKVLAQVVVNMQGEKSGTD